MTHQFNFFTLCLSLLLLSVFNYSCQKDETPLSKQTKEQLEEDKYFVPIEFAKAYAINYRQNATFFEDRETDNNPIAISTFRNIEEEGALPTAYIFNFVDGKGFVIIAADLRAEPILAFSEKSYFNLEKAPSGLITWADVKHNEIKQVRLDGTDITVDAAMLWSKVVAKACDPNCTNYPQCIEDASLSCVKKESTKNTTCTQANSSWPNCVLNTKQASMRVNCIPLTATRGPLLSTTWDQGCGYNIFTPTESQLNCTGAPCDRAPVGCVATAMAQIMRHHEHPNRNWSLMPDDAGSVFTALLMKNIGDEVNMNYDCGGSGATISKARSAFKNDFDYSSSINTINYSSSKSSTIKSEIIRSRPVLFSGYHTKKMIAFVPVYKDGHAWVCDGYKITDYCAFSTLHFHMNWGWGGSSDGYYSYTTFNPSSFNFRYKQQATISIKP